MLKPLTSRFHPKRLHRATNSIRFRLTGWYVLVLGLVLGLFGIVVYVVLSNSLYSGLDELLHSRSEQLVAAYNINDGHINPQEQDENGPALPVEGEIWLLVDQQGKLLQRAGKISEPDVTRLTSLSPYLSSTSPQTATFYQSVKLAETSTNPTTTSNSTTTNQLDYRFYFAPIVENGQAIGSLVLGRSRESVEATLHRLLLVLLLAAPAALLLSAGGGYWLAGRAMRPVRTITQAASEIEETDLSRRLNLKGSEDELGELAATFDRMIGRLEEAFKRQRQFTGDASHELRTPLTIVELEVERALAYPRTVQEYQQALEIIRSENGYMSRLVADLLTLARADTEGGATTFHLQKLDLSDLTLEVIERLIPLARQKELELCADELPELLIYGNRTYLTQMITNLVENALKYTSGCGSRVEVCTGIKQAKWAYIRVEDDGPGIETEHLPHLFDRFYRVDQARSYSEVKPKPTLALNTNLARLEQSQEEGSGLGLSIVKWVSTAHGGEVKVESHLGTGTTFEVWLPLLRE